MNNDHINYGTLLSEHWRTWWSLIMFVVFFLYPWLMSLLLTLGMIYAVVGGKQWETVNYFLIFFFGGFTVWFSHWILHRFFGAYYVAIYQKGVLLRNYFGEQFIAWETIEDTKINNITFSFQLIIIFWRTLTIKHRDGVIVIESGTGFTFSDWPLLFQLNGYSNIKK